MTMLLLLGVAYAILAIIMLFMILRSPRGYEDECGFHHGPDRRDTRSPDAIKTTAPD